MSFEGQSEDCAFSTHPAVAQSPSTSFQRNLNGITSERAMMGVPWEQLGKAAASSPSPPLGICRASFLAWVGTVWVFWIQVPQITFRVSGSWGTAICFGRHTDFPRYGPIRLARDPHFVMVVSARFALPRISGSELRGEEGRSRAPRRMPIS